MKTIKQKYLIDAPVAKVWQALIDPEMIEGWGGGPAKMDVQVGTKFTLWGGDIHGTNVRVEDNKLLEQDWYGGDWAKASKVRFELTEKGGKTEIDLLHENVPDSESKDIDEDWKTYYLGPLKEYLEK